MVRVAFAGPYPPRRHGIAAYTEHLVRAIPDREVVAVTVASPAPSYPAEVHHRILADVPAGYARSAAELSACVDVVSMQYTASAWDRAGGDGARIFAADVRLPLILTPHQVPADPASADAATLTELVRRADGIVALSEAAATQLVERYGADPAGVVRIPHGVPDLPIVEPEPVKVALGLPGVPLILTFGLIDSATGCATAIEALPEIARRHPDVLHVIVGIDHPDAPPAEATARRSELVARAAQLGVGAHVRFVDAVVGRGVLIRWLQAADVVVAPGTDLDEMSSEAIVYARAAGRPVVATASAYAAEVLADDRGRLVPPGSADALAAAVNDLLDDAALRRELGRLGHEASRAALWTTVAAAHERLFERIALERGPVPGTGRRSDVVVGGRLRRWPATTASPRGWRG